MQTCKSMRVGRKSAHLAASRYHTLPTPPCRPVAVKAMASSADGKGSQAQQLFQQHKVLLGAGFSYDQAALILQVSQQRKSASPQLTSAGPAAADSELSNTESTPASAPSTAAAAAAAAAADGSSQASLPALKTLEDRIAFLELELLKQSLVNPLPAASDFPADLSTNSSSSSSSGGKGAGGYSSFSSTAAALNPAGAGAGGLNAAAAAAASRWNADSSLYRQPVPPGPFGGNAPPAGQYSQQYGPYAAGLVPGPPEAISISTQLAAAAELGQLDPEVYALAEALAVRQGFAALPAEPQAGAYGLNPQQQVQQQRRPSGIWGRSGGRTGGQAVRYARPLSANAWGVQGESSMYDPAFGHGEPLLNRQDLEENVPYEPSGWAIAGTIVVVYLGVIVTFLAMCIGDVPY